MVTLKTYILSLHIDVKSKLNVFRIVLLSMQYLMQFHQKCNEITETLISNPLLYFFLKEKQLNYSN